LVPIAAPSSSTTSAPHGYLSSFAGLRTPRELTPKKPMHLIIKGPFLWLADHIILGSPDDANSHFHLLTITRSDPRRANELPPPDTFFLIDGDQLLTYKKSQTPYQPDPLHFTWKTMVDFSNIGTLTLLVIDK
jgi:hypothetical protein